MYFNPEWTEKMLTYVFSVIGKALAVDSEGNEWVGLIETAVIRDGMLELTIRFEEPDLKYNARDIVSYSLIDKDGVRILTDEDGCPYHKIRGQGLYWTPAFQLMEELDDCECDCACGKEDE